MTVTKNDPVRCIKRLVVFLTFVFLLAGIACFIHEPYVRKQKYRENLHNSKNGNQELEQMVNDISRRKIRFKSDCDFVKHIAREMGLVCPHETVFQFVEPAPR